MLTVFKHSLLPSLFSGIFFLLIIIVNPITSIDIIIMMMGLLYIGHSLLREKLLLFFLAFRPTLDLWREYTPIPGLNINAIFSIVLILWCAYTLVTHLGKRYQIPGIFIAFLLLGCIIASTAYSVFPFTTLVEGMKFGALLMLFATAFICIDQRKITLTQLALTLFVGSIIPIVFALFQLFLGEGITTFEIRNRIFGTFAHPNVFAFFIVSLFFIHFHYTYILKRTNPSFRALSTTYTITLLTLLAYTFTRGAWIGLLVFLITLGLFKFRTQLILSLFGIVLLYVGFFSINTLLIRYTDLDLRRIQLVERITTRDAEADSISWRSELVRESIPIFVQHPFFGFGYGTFPMVWENSQGPDHINDDSTESHNDYLRLAIELGGIGLTLYVIFLAHLFFSAWGLFYSLDEIHERDMVLHLIAWIAAFGIMSFGDNMLHHTPVMWMTWTWWGAMFGSLYLDKKEYFNFIRSS